MRIRQTLHLAWLSFQRQRLLYGAAIVLATFGVAISMGLGGKTSGDWITVGVVLLALFPTGLLALVIGEWGDLDPSHPHRGGWTFILRQPISTASLVGSVVLLKSSWIFATWTATVVCLRHAGNDVPWIAPAFLFAALALGLSSYLRWPFRIDGNYLACGLLLVAGCFASIALTFASFERGADRFSPRTGWIFTMALFATAIAAIYATYRTSRHRSVVRQLGWPFRAWNGFTAVGLSANGPSKTVEVPSEHVVQDRGVRTDKPHPVQPVVAAVRLEWLKTADPRRKTWLLGVLPLITAVWLLPPSPLTIIVTATFAFVLATLATYSHASSTRPSQRPVPLRILAVSPLADHELVLGKILPLIFSAFAVIAAVGLSLALCVLHPVHGDQWSSLVISSGGMRNILAVSGWVLLILLGHWLATTALEMSARTTIVIAPIAIVSIAYITMMSGFLYWFIGQTSWEQVTAQLSSAKPVVMGVISGLAMVKASVVVLMLVAAVRADWWPPSHLVVIVMSVTAIVLVMSAGMRPILSGIAIERWGQHLAIGWLATPIISFLIMPPMQSLGRHR